MKKVKIIISIIVTLLLSTTVYFTLLKKEDVHASGIKAVSPKSAVLIEVKNYYNFNKKLRTRTNFWPELINEKAFARLNKTMINLDSTFSQITELDILIKKHPLLISLTVVGKSNIVPTYIIELDKLSSETTFTKHLKKKLNSKAEISSKEYEHTHIFIINFKNKNQQNIYYSLYKGLLISSPSALLVESAIRQIDNPNSITNNHDFQKIYKTAGRNVDANFYIQFKPFSVLFKKFIHKDYQKTFQNTRYLGDWVELDLNMDRNSINLNGFTQTNDSNNNYLNILKEQSSGSLKVDEILPSNSSVFLSLNLSDLDLFLEKEEDYLNRKGKLQEHKEWFNNFKTKYQFNIYNALKEIVEGEITIAYTQINPLDLSQKTFFILETDGQSQTMNSLEVLLENWANKKGTDINSLIYKYPITTTKTQNIYSFPEANLAHMWLGSMFSHAKSNYFTFIDDYLVFGQSKNDLKKFIDDNELKATLMNDSFYNELKDEVSSESNIHLYANISSSKELVNSLFSPILYSKYLASFSSIKKFQAVVLQMNSSDEMFYSNIFIKYNPTIREKPHTVWESKIDTALAIKPKVVVNHRSNQKEIFVQDLNYKIYLLDRNGNILWTEKLTSQIMGDIYQIDVYRNNKLQYLFNTKDKIYIVDRNGNNIDNFPINLRAEATAGIALFDYDKSRDYRMFIPCKDKKIYVYNTEGKILPGWEFGETEATVRTIIQHFRIEDRDYILTSDKNRIYILDRKGEERIELNKSIRKSINNKFYLVYKDKLPYFASTNPNGSIFMINENGNVFEKEGIPATKEHNAIFTNLNSNKLFDIVYTDNTKMTILYDLKKKTTHDFENLISIAIPFEFSTNNTKIGITNFENEEIYLFNSNGTVYKDFPLKGATEFSISLFRTSELRFNLITGSKDGFLYNYEVP